ncbi:hypothetical protein DPMN_007370 [Dreissena polymorpha]|uniref:Uncharacterized protein n=1 Tax=Dreissena polymorpha TaxID=45954 RepID=A0A9D4MU73_DREPO|nr:hypothetical protein DPMN_007370 [Dreissena polymorpha]
MSWIPLNLGYRGYCTWFGCHGYDYVSAPPVVHEEEVEDEEEYHDQDLGGVEEHKSIILHLLSQLKLGMDLTKVSLSYYSCCPSSN